jgi:hypothetical protein
LDGIKGVVQGKPWISQLRRENLVATIEITLPDGLAKATQNAGLLTPAYLERWLREQLRTRRVEELFTAMDRMAVLDEPAVLSPGRTGLGNCRFA